MRNAYQLEVTETKSGKGIKILKITVVLNSKVDLKNNNNYSIKNFKELFQRYETIFCSDTLQDRDCFQFVWLNKLNWRESLSLIFYLDCIEKMMSVKDYPLTQA